MRGSFGECFGLGDRFGFRVSTYFGADIEELACQDLRKVAPREVSEATNSYPRTAVSMLKRRVSHSEVMSISARARSSGTMG